MGYRSLPSRLKWFFIGCVIGFFMAGVLVAAHAGLYDWFHSLPFIGLLAGIGLVVMLPTLCGIAFIVWVIYSIAKGR